MNQIELHKRIDELLVSIPTEAKTQEISAIFNEVEDDKAREDARRYFFNNADHRWLEPLWGNHFLDAIKVKDENPKSFSYSTPELNYLVRVAENEPEKVTEIILDTPLSSENFNPEVIAQFLRICTKIPAEQLIKLIPKITEEKWMQLMQDFNSWGFEYKKMLQILQEAGDYESMLELARSVLSVKSKTELEEQLKEQFRRDNPFYFNGLSHIEVFSYLLSVGETHKEKSLEVAVNTLQEVIFLSSEEATDSIFRLKDGFPLFDLDFFVADKPRSYKSISARDDVRELASTAALLLKEVVGKSCEDADYVKNIYKTHIDNLPDSRVRWRLCLYALSLCPNVFKNELKTSLFWLFEVGDSYIELLFGAEYERALESAFSVLSESDQEEYITKAVSFFKEKHENEQDPNEDRHLHYGSRVLSIIDKNSKRHLNKPEKQHAEASGFTISKEYEPRPTISEMRGGTVQPRGPIDAKEFAKLSIDEIIRKLKDEWRPQQLSEKYKDDDFLSPRNAEGAGELLKGDISSRPDQYLEKASEFFDRENLSSHYTHSYLRGIQAVIKAKDSKEELPDFSSLIQLFCEIAQSGKNSFPRGKDENEHGTFLAQWDVVHQSIADVLEMLLREDRPLLNVSEYRSELVAIFECLLSYPDPTPEDEQPKTASMSVTRPENSEPLVSDPFSMAINTARGGAFQAFVLFVSQDGKTDDKGKEVVVDDEIKDLYERVLETENTRAIMFLFGHYLPFFYLRDSEWMRSLLGKIFPTNEEQSHLYLAAWEGYLSNNLFKEIFTDNDFRSLYERGLDIADVRENHREYFKDPDEGIAIHLALAYMHFDVFDESDELFKQFWGENVERQKEFVSFIGRTYIHGDNANAKKLLESDPNAKNRLEVLWKWILENVQNSEVLTEFGYWINTEKNLFETEWLAEKTKTVLKQTGGIISWDYGLMKSIGNMAEKAPEYALEIAQLYLLEGGVKQDRQFHFLAIDDEWYEALKKLHNNPQTQSGTEQLINDLIVEGGQPFWKFENIVRDKEEE